MKTENPEFNHIDRAAYELPRLLGRLGDVSSGDRLTADQINIAKAAEGHAYNANYALMRGIEAIGKLIRRAGIAEDGTDDCDLSALGNLLTHLAVEAQHVQDTEANMSAILLAQQARKA